MSNGNSSSGVSRPSPGHERGTRRRTTGPSDNRTSYCGAARLHLRREADGAPQRVAEVGGGVQGFSFAQPPGAHGCGRADAAAQGEAARQALPETQQVGHHSVRQLRSSLPPAATRAHSHARSASTPVPEGRYAIVRDANMHRVPGANTQRQILRVCGSHCCGG